MARTSSLLTQLASGVSCLLSDSDRAADWHDAVYGLIHTAVGARAPYVLALPYGPHLPCLRFLHCNMPFQVSERSSL